MFMNIVPTVTQKQCTESKIGWVHQVHSLASLRAQVRPGYAHCAISWRAVVPYHRPWAGRIVAWADLIAGPSGRVTGLGTVSWPCVARLTGRVVAHIATQRPASCPIWSRYNPCIATQFPAKPALLLSRYN